MTGAPAKKISTLKKQEILSLISYSLTYRINSENVDEGENKVTLMYLVFWFTTWPLHTL